MKKNKNTKSAQSFKGVQAPTQQYLKIAEIRDNTVVLKDGSIRSILRVSSVNFDLKSEQEQNGLIYGFQRFLNTLEFPVQILVRSKKLDIDNYLEKLISMAEKQENPLLRDQTYDYIDFVKKLIDLADIMKKEFYIIVPNDAYDPNKTKSTINSLLKMFQSKDSKANYQKRQKEFQSIRKLLDQRTQAIQNALQTVGLTSDPLNTEEIIRLFYESYNPDLAEFQKFERVADTNIDQAT